MRRAGIGEEIGCCSLKSWGVPTGQLPVSLSIVNLRRASRVLVEDGR